MRKAVVQQRSWSIPRAHVVATQYTKTLSTDNREASPARCHPLPTIAQYLRSLRQCLEGQREMIGVASSYHKEQQR
jgi:hypothetical protein